MVMVSIFKEVIPISMFISLRKKKIHTIEFMGRTMRIYRMPEDVLGISIISSYLMLTITLSQLGTTIMPTLEIKIKQTEARRGQVTCPRVYSKSQSLNARSQIQNPHSLPGITLPFTTNGKGLYWWREVVPNHCLQSMIQKTLAPQHVSWQNKGSLVKC